MDPEYRRRYTEGITAHRGNSMEFPENTIASFKSALEIGVEWIELDIHETKDHQLVVIHDRDTERVGDRRLVVAEATYEDLLPIDVADRFRMGKRLSIRECPRAKTPLLSEVIQLIQAQRRTRLSIQPKVFCVSKAIEVIRHMAAESMVGFNEQDLQKMRQVKELVPSIPVFYDRREFDLGRDIEDAKTYGFESIVLHYSLVSEEYVEGIHRAGLRAGVWTVDDPDMMIHTLDLGLDQIYTNAPRVLLEVKKARGGRD